MASSSTGSRSGPRARWRGMRRRRRGDPVVAPRPGLDPAAATRGLPAPDLQPMPADPRQDERAGRGRALTRVRRRVHLVGVPVTAIVVVELLGAAVLVGAEVSIGQESVVLAIAVAIAVLVLVPVRGMRLSTWVGSAASYVGRRHTLAASVTTPAAPPDLDPRRRARVTRAGDNGDADPTPVAVPPDVQAFFPGLTAMRSTSRSDREIGLIQWQGRWLAVLALEAAGADVLSTTQPSTVPVDRVLRSLAGRELGLDAVSIVTQSLYGSLARFGRGSLPHVAAQLGAVAQLARTQGSWVTVRIDPVAAAAAIAARGGGVLGLGRLAAAALDRIESDARDSGLIGRALDADTALRAMSSALLEPSRSAAPAHWNESWKSVTSAVAHHRCFAVSAWHDRPLERVLINAGFGVTVAHELRDIDGNEVSVTSVLRLSAADGQQLEQAARQLRASCNAAGVAIRALRGRQASAMRMTVPAGQR